MRRNQFILVIAIVVIALCTSCNTTKLDTISFTIQNNTAGRVASGYIRLPGASSWETIFTASLNNGESRVVSAPMSALDIQGRADIQLWSEGGVRYTTFSQIITPDVIIIVRQSDIDTSSPMSVTLQNHTGSTISQGYIKLPTTISWVHFFTADIANNNSLAVTVPNTVIDNERLVDIQLKTTNGILYTKDAYAITYNATIPFGVGDLKLPEVTIINRTTDVITRCLIKNPINSTWSDLFEAQLPINGSQSVSITLNYLNNDNRSDLQFLAGSDIKYTRLLCEITYNGEIIIVADDLAPDSARTVTIQNNTGVTIANAFVRVAGTPDWGSSLFINPLEAGLSRPIPINREDMNTQYYSDIQLRATNGSTYTRLGWEIRHNSVIPFSISDKDL